MARLSAIAIAVLLCGVVSVESRQPSTPRLRAGAARVEITPKKGDLTVATDSIRDPLYARAIVVDDGGACAVIVGLDLGGARITLAALRSSRACGLRCSKKWR
jgi:hypothetical protein